MTTEPTRADAWQDIEVAKGVWRDWPDQHAIELSKAISLKRIADALWGDDQNTGILQVLMATADRTGGPSS